MKSRSLFLIVVLFCITILLSLIYCRNDPNSYDKMSECHNETFCGGYFIVESSWEDLSYSYKIVYAKDTGVKYLVVKSSNRLSINPLYNTDGSLQISDNFVMK